MLHSTGAAPAVQRHDEALSAIRDSLDRIRFGTIAITIHEGRILQLDITEKRRLAR